MLLKLILWLFILLISTNSYSETLCGVNTGICAEINAEHQLEVSTEIKDADGDLISIDSSGNLKVTLGTALDAASDDITTYNQKASTATGTVVACNTTTNGELLLAANTSRIGVRILNQSAVEVYICLGDSTCSTSTDGMRFTENMGIEDYYFTGAIYCTVNSGTASVYVGEY